MTRWTTGGAAALALAATVAAGAAAGEAQDRLFATGVLDAVETGTRLVYGHERASSAAIAANLPAIEDGAVVIRILPAARTEGRDAAVSLRDGPRTRALNPFPASAGNPLLMVFMETSVRSMAAATGGSPFYIRNRMREALRNQDRGAPVEIEVDGATVQARRFSFRPFEGDPNAARMGAFAELTIDFVLSDAVPGHYALLETTTGPGADGAPVLRETITFETLEADG